MQSDPAPEIERGADEVPMGVRLLRDWLGHPVIRYARWYGRPSVTRLDGVWN